MLFVLLYVVLNYCGLSEDCEVGLADNVRKVVLFDLTREVLNPLPPSDAARQQEKIF